MAKEYAALKAQIAEIDAKLMAWHQHNELSRRLAEVPGIGPIGACLLAMKMLDPHAFRSGRDFAAWIGLTPKDHSTAGKMRLGVITRAGDETLRSASGGRRDRRDPAGRASKRASPRPGWSRCSSASHPSWQPSRLANKTARIAWKLMVTGESYNRRAQPCSLAAVHRRHN